MKEWWHWPGEAGPVCTAAAAAVAGHSHCAHNTTIAVCSMYTQCAPETGVTHTHTQVSYLCYSKLLV